MPQTSIEPTTSQQADQGIPFRQFLNESVNLLTIFGIFNALCAWSATIAETSVAIFISPIFLLLSIITWWQVIVFSVKSSDGSKIFEVFGILMFLVELSLCWYFIVSNAPMLFLLGCLGVLFGYIFLLQQGTIKIFRKWMYKWAQKKGPERSEKRLGAIVALHLLIVMVPAAFLTKVTYRLAFPHIWTIMPESVRALPIKWGIEDSLYRLDEIQQEQK